MQDKNMQNNMISAVRDAWLSTADSLLLRQCEQDFFIATGNGGQHRNKTESAVRLIHTPSGVAVTETGSRHREENRIHALRKLRHAIAFQLRCPNLTPPTLPEPSLKHPDYPLFLAKLLDLLAGVEYAVSDAGAAMGLSTGQLIRLLSRDPTLWQYVNHERQKRNLSLLKQ